MPQSASKSVMRPDPPPAPVSGKASPQPPRIRRLPALLVNQIAAGEVIERPASVVKELVENALDAGATRLDVRLEQGGIELVRVADNGCGMSPEELPLALTAHATSKIAEAADLDRIATLGFRGEAIASIASVSRLLIRSRQPDCDAAAEIHAEGDRVEPVRPASGAPGTVIEVRNLFFNTPARRKFMRTPRTEQARCVDWLRDLAMAHPAVGIRVTANDRVLLDLPPDQRPSERILAIIGQELGPQLLEVSADLLDDARGVLLWGLVGRPEIARPTTAGQHVFLNGRVLRDRTIQHAIKEAYRGLIEPGRFPTAVLMLEMAPDGVDVNVHPAKLEVRFRDSSLVHTAVLRALRQGLERHDLTRVLGDRATHGSVADQQTPGMILRSDASTEALFSSGLAGASKRAGDPPGFAQPHTVEPRVGGWDVSPATDNEREEMERLVDAIRSVAPQGSTPAGAASAPPASPIIDDVRSDLATRVVNDGPRSHSVLQVHHSYLVAEDGDGLVLVDQHALHERVMFESLRRRLDQGMLASQSLLRPIPIQVSPGAADRIDDVRAPLSRLGFELELIGPSTVGVRAAPTLLLERSIDPREVLEHFLGALGESGGSGAVDAEGVLHEVLDTMACKAAVKAGDPLTPSEIHALLALRDSVERTTNCPHGRPTSVRLSRKDLDKLFERR